MREVLERTREAIENERLLADGRPTAMRIRFEGATVISGELAAYPERLEQQIKALGAEIAGDNLWIERVENAAAGKARFGFDIVRRQHIWKTTHGNNIYTRQSGRNKRS